MRDLLIVPHAPHCSKIFSLFDKTPIPLASNRCVERKEAL
jgi:hypothetical protein